jgi:hypothetical protein
MAKKNYLQKQISRKVGGLKRSTKSKVGLRKNSKGCLGLLLFMVLTFTLLSFI